MDDYALLDYTLHQPKTHSNADGTITRPSGEFKGLNFDPSLQGNSTVLRITTHINARILSRLEGDDLSINQLTGYRRLETKKRKRRRRYLRSHPDVVD